MATLPAVWADAGVVEGWSTTPNAALGGRRVRLLTGATLGGSSAVNAAQWTVPTGVYAADWGVAGLDDAAAGAAYAAAAAVVRPAPPAPGVTPAYTAAYVAAAAAAGRPLVADPTNRSAAAAADGVWPNLLAADAGGRRRDACSAYLEPVRAAGGACAANLVLLQGVTVSRVVLDTEAPCAHRWRGRRKGGWRGVGHWLRGKRGGGERGGEHACRRSLHTHGKDTDGRLVAAGVELVPSASLVSPPAGTGLNGTRTPPAAPHTLLARAEVMLTAGPYGSPKLLQLSGVGPPAVLAAARVRPVVDLPVGRHVLIRPVGVLEAAYAGVPLAPTSNATATTDPAAVAAWRAGAGGVVGTAVSSTNGRLAAEAAYTATAWGSFVTPNARTLQSYCFATPTTYGALALDPADPVGAPPVIDARLLASAAQVAQLVRCLTASRAVAAAMPPPFVMTDVRPPPGAPLDEAFVRDFAGAAYHTIGGAAVGRVTDPHLRVRGVRRLRVVDASVIPFLPPTAGPVSSVYMLAEHVAGQLLEGKGAWATGA
ncbi:hypothetical protein I4F81_008830 [Pyropia yezoensis]|uniref:Choline dehydrogenase n=2 Tax=Pyropia yezoensis TaxID=2788 RepID=A0A515J4J8_PYRYE|nr:hypothetical protein I4F81_008830 [Neopyropia yezoensis]QDM14410.1 choline dehydrogenase [Neopyropia yezoensis]